MILFMLAPTTYWRPGGIPLQRPLFPVHVPADLFNSYMSRRTTEFAGFYFSYLDFFLQVSG